MKEIVQSAKGKFTMFDGTERDFIVASVSRDDNIVYGVYNNEGEVTEEVLVNVGRELVFGVAVLNPADKYNERLGLTIATGKAKKKTLCRVAFPDPFLLSKEVVDSLLNNLVKKIQNNPALAFDNYEEMKKSYERKQTRA